MQPTGFQRNMYPTCSTTMQVFFFFIVFFTFHQSLRSAARPMFFSRIDDSHCYRIYSSLTTVRCFDNAYVGKQPVAWKEYCAEYWLKELQESMDRCTGRLDITEILLKNGVKHYTSNQFNPFPKLQILDSSKLKYFADDNLQLHEND